MQRVLNFKFVLLLFFSTLAFSKPWMDVAGGFTPISFAWNKQGTTANLIEPISSVGFDYFVSPHLFHRVDATVTRRSLLLVSGDVARAWYFDASVLMGGNFPFTDSDLGLLVSAGLLVMIPLSKFNSNGQVIYSSTVSWGPVLEGEVYYGIGAGRIFSRIK